MSEVYIRSQNKEKLYRLGGNYACVEYGEYEDIKKKRGGAEADKKRHVEPDQTAQYKFSDLQMSLYYTIYI